MSVDRLIIDAGAPIGLATTRFPCSYPEALIVALEPEPASLEMLSLDTAAMPNVRAIQAGHRSRRGRRQVLDPGGATWAFSVAETNDPAGVSALGLQDPMAEFPDRPALRIVEATGSFSTNCPVSVSRTRMTPANCGG